MHKSIQTLAAITIIAIINFTHVNASTIRINDLIEMEKVYDGQEVTIEGEAIGENMERGNYSWININDGSNAIGAWLSKSDAEKVHSYGNYKNIGDTLRITGIFNKDCREHGGEADFHVTQLTIVKEGYVINEKIEKSKIVSSITLILIVGIFGLLFLIVRRRINLLSTDR